MRIDPSEGPGDANAPVVSVGPSDRLQDAMQLMADRGLGELPVVEDRLVIEIVAALARELTGAARVKVGGKYVVVSETTGRRFGTYDTLAEARSRLRQIEFFKRLKARTTARGGRRASA
jgi:CBS domain-containing protein